MALKTKNQYRDFKNALMFVGRFVATATGTGGTSTATLHRPVGLITTAALTTAAAASHVLTLTNNLAEVGDLVIATVQGGGTDTASFLTISAVAGNGTIVFTLGNDGADASNGTTKFVYMLLKTS